MPKRKRILPKSVIPHGPDAGETHGWSKLLMEVGPIADNKPLGLRRMSIWEKSNKKSPFGPGSWLLTIWSEINDYRETTYEYERHHDRQG